MNMLMYYHIILYLYSHSPFLKISQSIYTFLFFRTGFQPTKGWRLIRLMRKGMRTGQALFPLGIEPVIPRVRLWKELLATGAQATWLMYYHIILYLYSHPPFLKIRVFKIEPIQ